MALTVEYVTLGDASNNLNVPSATLRHWTDQLEEYNVHYVKRNNRNERIYYETDLEVFKYLRDLKEEYGRKTTTKDLAYMIADKGEAGQFVLRTKEEAPLPKPSNRTADLLSQEDIKQLMQSERVRQFMSLVIEETTKTMKEDITKEVVAEIQANNKKMEELVERIEQTVKDRDEQTLAMFREWDRKREEKQQEQLKQEQGKGFLAKLFGGK